MCGDSNNIRTEHYFECPLTENIKTRRNTKELDLQGILTCNVAKASDFLSDVEKLLEPKWTKDDKKNE